ncbi:LVIVD repeat-containing protein [Singulisphaera sp. GP187]|uniref:Ig-like domain repeat protein n=1 Tax=Singulisphaera sp. GP187 TaxID=1882752 RepID=UPI00092C4301|nr:Ig-like domain repeat protein [Singulisphaera sp. GP187]SIO57707.1 LVIVD repeat-containing protein [Singulisphaera sp. GP187]
MSRGSPKALDLSDRRPPLRPRRPKPFYLAAEWLENRLMLDGASAALPSALVVGRTLSSYTVGGIQNNQVAITYSVYNEQTDPESGVQLTTTLAPGVTIVSASAAPARNGQELTWGLGTIDGFGRTSVTLVVARNDPASLPLDLGSQALATLGTQVVSDTAPAATLRAGAIPAEFLTATVDANSQDPFIQQKAAELDYDPAEIFSYLRDAVGFESYTGSLRGARGTLWSNAGNALDEASLGVALYRASGIPARYVQGTLSDAASQQLILSMFADPLRVVGFLSPGVAASDPAHDPTLLAETRQHYWIQFDLGGGFQDADPTFKNGAIGQTFTAAQGTFAEVPDALRHKVTITLERELTQNDLFGGSSQSVAPVLTDTFDTVELVGRPITIGHFVSSSTSGFVFSATTNTYTPYLLVGDGTLESSHDPLLLGTSYQEVLTNFPFGSQILTGVFLKIKMTAPDGTVVNLDKTLADRFGVAARQKGGGGALSVNPGEPLITPLDLTTLSIEPGRYNLKALETLNQQLAAQQATFTSFAQQVDATPPGPARDQLLGQLSSVFGNALIAMARSRLAQFAVMSDTFTDQLGSSELVKAYFDSPRVVLFDSRAIPRADGTVSLRFSMDLLRDLLRAIAVPGQNAQANIGFQLVRGLSETFVETIAMGTPPPTATGAPLIPVSAVSVFQSALAQNIPLVVLSGQNRGQLDALPFSAQAKLLISNAIDQGKVVLVPTQNVTINGEPRIAWYETDPVTGATVDVMDDGGHQAVFASTAEKVMFYTITYLIEFNLGVVAGIGIGQSLFSLARFAFFSAVNFNSAGLPTNVQTFLQIKNWIGTLFNAAIQVAKGIPNVFFAAGFALGLKFSFDHSNDPPLQDLLISPRPLDAFKNLGQGSSPGDTIATAIVPDPLYTLPIQGAQFPMFRIGIKNLGASTRRFSLNLVDLPAGFSGRTSIPEVVIPPGATAEVGLILFPTGPIAQPGTLVSFGVQVADLADLSRTTTQSLTFALPEVHGVSVTLDRTEVSTTPGNPVQVVLRLQATGNVPEHLTFATRLSNGLTLSGLTPVTINPGDTVTQTVTLTPAPGTPLNSALSASLDTKFGTALPETRVINVNVVVPGATAIADASVAASQLGNSALAARLNDLSLALTNLVGNPSSEVFKSQALASLDSVIGQLGSNPAIAPLRADLTSAKATLANAGTSAQIQGAIVALGNVLDSLGSILTNLIKHRFELSFVTNSQVAQPQSPSTFSLLLRNLGTETTTYLLSLPGLPADVTGSLSQTSITLAPGAFTTSLQVTLTPTSTTQLAPLSFVVQASAQGAPEISGTATGSLTARSEFVSVVSVSTDPPFVDPGGTVKVSTRVLNAVNREQQALASFVVKNAGGQTVFNSQAVPVTLGVLTSLTTVPLGPLDTTNLSLGEYTIVVSLTDAGGQPIPGATGEGRLLVGSPVSSTIAVTPNVLPTGTSTVANTLTINSTAPLVGPLGVLSQTAVPGAAGLLRNGNLLYVGANDGIRVYDITNPSQPQLVRTVGTTADLLKMRGDRLYALKAGGAFGSIVVSIYSIADPANPQLLGATPGIPYDNATDMIVTDTHVFVPIFSIFFFLANNDIFEQTGDLLSIDVSNPAAPHLDGVLRNTYGTNNDNIGNEFGINLTGGDGNLWSVVQVDPTTLLVTGSTAVHTDTQTGSGVVDVIDISDPTHMKIVRSLTIPGTVQAVGLAMEGNRALVTGSTGGWNDFGTDLGFTGNFVLATLDLTDPRNPQLISTQTLPRASRGLNYDVPLGNGLFAYSSLGAASDSSQLTVVDATNPQQLGTKSTTVPAAVTRLFGEGNFLYTTSTSGLIIYQIAGDSSIPLTARVDVPKNRGVAVVPGSFSLAPTQIITGVDRDTYVWNLSLIAASKTEKITWQSTVTNMQAGESRPVTLGASVAFTSQGAPGQVTLPALDVSANQILGLDPASRSVRPGAAAPYTLVVSNPTNAAVTYALSIQGVSPTWSSLPASILVPAGGTLNVPFTLTSEALAALGAYGFAVTASAPTGATGSVQGSLTLAGAPVLPDTNAHGVVVTLIPTQATAGQGTGANYVVRVTNTGSVRENFALTVNGPGGIVSLFGRDTVDVAPGAGNFQEIPLTLSALVGTMPGLYDFTVNARATSSSGVTGSVAGTLNVTAFGVAVGLTPLSTTPTGVLDMTVTNKGTVTDTFNLTLAGPGALTATLGQTELTLAPGASRVVSITTTSVNVAVPGALSLTAVATSRGNPAVKATATAAITIAPTVGLQAQFVKDREVLPRPGGSTFSLLVQNQGNTEDSYEAVITGSTGPVSAHLRGLDGTPAQTIPLFRLPGLSTGTLLLQVDLAAFGSGAVTIQVRSLKNKALVAQATASVSASATSTTSTELRISPNPVTAGQPVTLTATVRPAPGSGTPTGSIRFFDGALALGTTALDANGSATLVVPTLAAGTLTGLAPGSHTIKAVYSGDATHASSTSGPVSLVVNVPQTRGPTVTSLLRFGYHLQPTVLVLTFSAAMDSARAQDVRNYSLVLLRGRPVGRPITIQKAVYDPATLTVTLHPTERLKLSNVYQLTVRGTAPGGLTNTAGQFLDGQRTGGAGTDFRGQITHQTLAGPATASGGVVSTQPRNRPSRRFPTVSAAAVDALAASGHLRGGLARVHTAHPVVVPPGTHPTPGGQNDLNIRRWSGTAYPASQFKFRGV